MKQIRPVKLQTNKHLREFSILPAEDKSSVYIGLVAV